jgi:hypothetical protein
MVDTCYSGPISAISLSIWNGYKDETGAQIAFDNFYIDALDPIQVTRMRCALTTPSMVLWDENNQTILPNSGDFPPEIMSVKRRDPERVTFWLKPVLSTETIYRVAGYGFYTPPGGGTPKSQLIYGPKYISFPANTGEHEVVFDPSEIHPLDQVMKMDFVRWHFLKQGETKPIKQDVSKVIYCVPKPPIFPIEDTLFPPSGARIEVMDMSCRLAGGLKYQNGIRNALERGICKEYWGRQYEEDRHFDAEFGIFHLTNFLKDNLADSSDLSILHYMACKALGADMRLARLERIPGLTPYPGYPPESCFWLIVDGASRYLRQTFGPGLCIWKSGWHQVTVHPTEFLIYDPIVKYNLQGTPIQYRNPGGLAEAVFEQLYKPSVEWKYTLIGLMPILRQVD